MTIIAHFTTVVSPSRLEQVEVIAISNYTTKSYTLLHLVKTACFSAHRYCTR